MDKKYVIVKVKMSGYVEHAIEVDYDMVINDENVEKVLDQFDFSYCNDICDSIEWKLRYADSIEIIDDSHENVLWRSN